MAKTLFQRQALDEIITIPDDIISVYVVENHIWRDGGSPAARQNRQAEVRTVEEFLIDPVRSFLNDILRQMAAPYVPARRDSPIGQGYWIQAEFGSGKSHLLSFIGVLALGDEAAWEIVREKERKTGQGRRESLYNFYENGLAQKSREGKGLFVAVKTLVGQGGGAVGMSDGARSLTEYVLDAVAEQFYLETGRALPLYPAEILIQRFLNGGDLERYRRDLGKFLQDPAYFDEEEREELGDFLADLQNPDPGAQRDCGERLWRFYEAYLQTRPKIPMESEDILKHMVQQLLDEGYAGLLLILDEVSLFMKGRAEAQRVEDEKSLVVPRLRLHARLPARPGGADHRPQRRPFGDAGGAAGGAAAGKRGAGAGGRGVQPPGPDGAAGAAGAGRFRPSRPGRGRGLPAATHPAKYRQRPHFEPAGQQPLCGQRGGTLLPAPRRPRIRPGPCSTRRRRTEDGGQAGR